MIDIKNKCILIAAYHADHISEIVKIYKDDFIICADGGYAYALSQGIIPDIVIGDFDSCSFKIPKNIKTIVLPKEKDDTDTLYCVKEAISKDYTNIVLLGGIGGRLDHTLANIQVASYAYDMGAQIILADKKNYALVLENNEIKIPKTVNRFVSLLALDTKCIDVSISGVKYPLSHAIITNTFPIGISNEIIDEKATIVNGSGKLLITISEN